jgi:hypothetical protein
MGHRSIAATDHGWVSPMSVARRRLAFRLGPVDGETVRGSTVVDQ